ncbi:MAG: peptidylprolyl isomerase [Melioribacteraceae bacterium]
MNKSNFLRSVEILVVIFFLSLKLNAQVKDTSSIVAKVGENFTITFSDLHNYVLENFYNKIFLNEKSKGYIPALNRIINNRLKVFDFFDRNLHKDKKLIKNINRAINEELYNEYYELKYANKYVTDSAVKKVYGMMDRIVNYRTILLNKTYNMPQPLIDSLRNLAYMLKKKIEEGEDFGKLAATYSDDELSSKNNGIAAPIDWKTSLMSEINNIVFLLPEGSVRIIETPQAFYIIKIDEVKKVEVEPIERVENEIRAALRDAFSYMSIKDFEEEQKKLIDEDKIKWNESAVEKIVAWSKTPHFYEGAYKDTINFAISNKKNLTILTAPKYKVDLKKFLQILDDVLIMGRSSIIKEQDVKNFIIEALKIEAVAEKARQLGLEKIVLNPYMKSNFMVNEIVKLYDKEVIDKQVPEPDENALKKFYESNKDSLYYQLAKVNIYLVVANDTLSINRMKEDYKNGVPFEKLDKIVFVKRFIRKKTGEIISDNSNEKPILGKIAFNMNQDEIIGPIEYQEK